MKLRFRSAEENLLSQEDINNLREAFEDGYAAEHLDFITDQYVSLETIYQNLLDIAEDPGFWEDLPNCSFLTIKLFYKLVRLNPSLDVNDNLDTSVTYWANQASTIISKVLADKTPQS